MGARERLAWAGFALSLLIFLVGVGTQAARDREQFILRLTLLETNQARLISISETQVNIQSQIVLLRERQDNVIRRLDTMESEMQRLHTK